MRTRQLICAIAVASLVAGCSSGERKRNKAEAEVNRERIDLVDDYKKCVEDADADPAKVEACDTYLKAAEALK